MADEVKTNEKKHLIVDRETHDKARLLAAIRKQTIKDTIKELIEAELKK